MPSFPNVKLVGQPIAVLGWTAVVNVRCACNPSNVIPVVVKQTELGMVSDVGICPNCAKAMHIVQVRQNAQGLLEFGFELGQADNRPPEAAAAPLTTN